MFILTNSILYFSTDTTRLYLHKNVTTWLLVFGFTKPSFRPPVIRTLLVYSCYKLKLLLKYMCIHIDVTSNVLITGGLKDGFMKPKTSSQVVTFLCKL